VPEQNKKLSGFEALYQVDQEKQSQRGGTNEPKSNKEAVTKPSRERRPSVKTENKKESNKVSKSESNIPQRPMADYFEATTFKADRRKVLALKRLGLDLEPSRKLQDLFDEALADMLSKYGREVQ
jgi:hypothetical protein